MHSLKAKIIRDSLTLAVLELGATRTIDLLADICDRIHKEGGAEIESLSFRPDHDCWFNDSEKLKELRDSCRLHT